MSTWKLLDVSKKHAYSNFNYVCLEDTREEKKNSNTLHSQNLQMIKKSLEKWLFEGLLNNWNFEGDVFYEIFLVATCDIILIKPFPCSETTILIISSSAGG